MALPDHASGCPPGEEPAFPEIVELNVGGQVYITRYSTLTSVPDSLLWEMFSRKSARGLARDAKGRFFVDRDGFLFRYILDYMRDQTLVLPEHFPERGRLQREAEFFNLPELVKLLAPRISKQNSLGDDGCPSDPEESSPTADAAARNLSSLGAAAAAACASLTPGGGAETRRSGFITIGYRGSYTLGRDSQTDAKFRRVARIMVCGKTSLAKEVFGDTLNESRDPDRPPERYTSRYYLKFTFLEQAFDRLADAGFHMVACNSTGTCAFAHDQTDDKIWTSYTEYVFYRKGEVGSEEEGGSRPLPGTGEREAGTVPMGRPLRDNPPDNTQNHPEVGVAKELSASPGDQSETSTTLDLTNGFSPDAPKPPLAPHDLEPPPSPTLPPPPPPPPTMPPPLPPSVPPPPPPLPPKDTPPRPTTLLLRQSSGQENGPPPRHDPDVEEEKKLLEEELQKCIEDFRRIRIPQLFPDRKRHWQNDLLRKYNA